MTPTTGRCAVTLETHLVANLWWIAVTGGAVSALIYILLNTLTPLTYGVTPDIDRLIDSNNMAYLGLEMLTSFVFWWIGIFRNAASRQGP